MPTADGPRHARVAPTRCRDARRRRSPASLKEVVHGRLRKRGAVVGALRRDRLERLRGALRAAFGPRARARRLLMPEADRPATRSSSQPSRAETARRSRPCSRTSRGMLEAAGCYRRRDDAIRQVLPDYGEGWRAKIVLPSAARRRPLPPLLGRGRVARRRAAARRASPRRPTASVVAATNFKQRDPEDARVLPRRPPRLRGRRHAEPARVRPGLLRQERRRRGRRQADRAPLQDPGLPARRGRSACPSEIRSRPPTTDTYSLPQSQEEFYFSAPLRDAGPLPLRSTTRDFRRRPSRSRSGSPRRTSSASSTTSTPSGGSARCCAFHPSSPHPSPAPPRPLTLSGCGGPRVSPGCRCCSR